MLVAELIRNWREDEKDDRAPYFWSDRQLLRWLNEAYRQYAIKGQHLLDSSAPFTTYNLEAGVDRLPLDKRVLQVLQASTPHTDRLELLGAGALPILGRQVLGHPCKLEVNSDANEIRLYPAPAMDTVLQLLVVRLPLKPLDLAGELCDVALEDIDLLHHYLNFKAYAVQDAETINPQKSADGEARFLAGCAEVYQRNLARRRVNTGRIRYRD
ncbi:MULTISPECIES: hypothetical protein [unclassified Pseudomonas]|uniref:phage adaptor protein n=1 Tax=unclassified Pseudomonas TaxID=196821 RepID=UPI00131BB1F7|nr:MULTISPECIES: hypothetical protein [unclassified Pseudomonas]